jgi:hypothetical protein
LLAFWLINPLFEFFGLSGGVVKLKQLDFEFFGVAVGVVELRGERTGGAAARVMGDPSSLEQQNISQGMTSCAGGVRHATPACRQGLPSATGRVGMGICWTIFEGRFFEFFEVGDVRRPASSSGRPENQGNEYRTVGDTETPGIETLAVTTGDGGPAKELATGMRSGGDMEPASRTDAKGVAEDVVLVGEKNDCAS